MRYLTSEDLNELAVGANVVLPDEIATVESLIVKHRAAAWQECHESGTPWDNPYEGATDV